MIDLTAIILTYNEERNISECIKSLKSISKRIIVVDSFSTDKTVEIAKKMGAEIVFKEYVNISDKLNFGLTETNIETKWIIRLDADERITADGAKEIIKLCNDNDLTDINGIILRFEVKFMGKRMRYGGIYPFKKLALFKKKYYALEMREQDEHIYLKTGRTVTMKNDLLHENFQSVHEWVNKHNNYASGEVKDYINRLKSGKSLHLNSTSRFKRFMKYKVYYKLPLGFRPFLYFIYRYFFKLGFLDGKVGFIYAFLQAYWYRFLVDVKIYESKMEVIK